MPENSNDSLKQIARGTTIIFGGVIASMILNFLVRILLVRYTSQEDYGVYSLALTVVNIIIIIAMLGLDEGAARYIAFFLGKSDGTKVNRVVNSTLQLALPASLIGALALYVFSDAIGVGIFHTPELPGVLRIVAIAIPFLTLIQILTSITRGFNISIMKVVFNDVMKPLSFLVLLVAIIVLGMNFGAIIAAYVVSAAVTLLAFAVYTFRWYTQKYRAAPDMDRSVTVELLQFSIPLLSVNMLIMMMSYATTLLLGFFKTPVEVGKFDLAITMGSLLLTVVNSMGYIYTPTASNLYGKGEVESMKHSYVTSTKWTFLGTLPILFMFLVFPDVIVNLLFGSRYSDVGLVLQILAIGYLVNPLTGPNYHTLIAMGRTRVIIESFLVNACVNLALSVLLIPTLSVVGAAIAVAVSCTASNLLLSVRLYQLLGIHPLTSSYIKSVVSTLVLIGLTFFGLRILAITPSLLVAIVCFIVYMAICIVMLILLKAVDKEDIMILSSIEKKLGLHFISGIEKSAH